MNRKIVICGAAGRDFHDYNVLYRDTPDIEVLAFTAAQIPDIDKRTFPAELAGPSYPKGIPILPEAELTAFCLAEGISEVVFAYSDVPNDHVMNVAAYAAAGGANFVLPSPTSTMLRAARPVIAVCAVRTGCGKSQLARFIASHLTQIGQHVAVLRHPMPYGNLARQAVQRFATPSDLDAADCTLEEREEYEPHLAAGGVVYAGVDYQEILRLAQQQADVILWDGGNNDHSFIHPDLQIVVVDALRPHDLTNHFPGHSVLLSANLIVINKSNAASDEQLETLKTGLDRHAPEVPRISGSSLVSLTQPEALEGARVLIVEDGPTITHGGMPHGAGFAAVRDLKNVTIVDPRPFAVASISETFATYPHIGPVLPAMGYSSKQREDMRTTIKRAGIDWVVAGTPIDLSRALQLDVPVMRVHYDFVERVPGELTHHVDRWRDAWQQH